MKVWPLKFREHYHGELLFTNDAGGFFKSDQRFLHRYVDGALRDEDFKFLRCHGHAYRDASDAAFDGFCGRWARRINPVSELSYFILIPTLRCNLSCDYCQVSRAPESASGFDWNDEIRRQFLETLSKLDTETIKIEFQGGEPLLRLDILEEVRHFCRDNFKNAEFIVCTNLQSVSEESWKFLEAEDTFISTSFDGVEELHQFQRTKDPVLHDEFRANLQRAFSQFGTAKVSALPTLDVHNLPEPEGVMRSFVELGLRSIYLRRVNYQGFARKRYDFKGTQDAWMQFYRRFIDHMIECNWEADEAVEEYYLSHLLRRIFRTGIQNHVDLRNSSWLGYDYLVVDFDGKFYPTDEARMVSRVGRMDLSVGDLDTGIDEKKRDVLNSAASNFDDPDCVHCVYQAYCAPDVVDDLSRYGRIDIPRHETAHCQHHMALFDLAFELIYSDDPKVQYSLGCWLGIPNYRTELAVRLK
ncbi:His-Xaa-Ser system radical SAM maturase HxsB [uncultured Roseibium sp.]|uniref:His-Xaa-Ser system radical SAM maturase HxsB n=1 Tax=uncultured Roseibium sp. TaxID=1936171 RepID=UPI0026365991|nr:His-Xaa-Ser system radical SAM maturase HxsB [uncultured Roseibium sp.]